MINRDDILAAIVGISAGIGLGLLGSALANHLVKPKCPNCGYFISWNEPYCKNCSAILRWQ